VSKLRNRVIGRVFNSLGLIEQWGSGIQRMSTACREAGLPPPGLEEVGTRLRVTLWRQRVAAPILDARDQAILDAIPTDGASTGDIASAIELSTRATRTTLISLIDRGLIREVGAGPRDPKRRYFRST
jgi:predicted HTH transcriptional regulator